MNHFPNVEVALLPYLVQVSVKGVVDTKTSSERSLPPTPDEYL